jgi:hypothetical protein
VVGFAPADGTVAVPAAALVAQRDGLPQSDGDGGGGQAVVEDLGSGGHDPADEPVAEPLLQAAAGDGDTLEGFGDGVAVGAFAHHDRDVGAVAAGAGFVVVIQHELADQGQCFGAALLGGYVGVIDGDQLQGGVDDGGDLGGERALQHAAVTQGARQVQRVGGVVVAGTGDEVLGEE